MSASKGPLALTKGLELKARLMVKDEQVPNMWNMDKENSLVIVSFEGVDVIARRDCEDDIVSEPIRCRLTADTQIHKSGKPALIIHWCNKSNGCQPCPKGCEHRLNFILTSNAEKFSSQMNQIISSLRRTPNNDSSDSDVFESSSPSQSPPSAAAAAAAAGFHQAVTTPPRPTKPLSLSVTRSPRNDSVESSHSGNSNGTGNIHPHSDSGGINPSLDSGSSSDCENESPQLPPRHHGATGPPLAEKPCTLRSHTAGGSHHSSQIRDNTQSALTKHSTALHCTAPHIHHPTKLIVDIETRQGSAAPSTRPIPPHQPTIIPSSLTLNKCHNQTEHTSTTTQPTPHRPPTTAALNSQLRTSAAVTQGHSNPTRAANLERMKKNHQQHNITHSHNPPPTTLTVTTHRTQNTQHLNQHSPSNRAVTVQKAVRTTTKSIPGEYGDYRDEYQEHLSPSLKKKTAQKSVGTDSTKLLSSTADDDAVKKSDSLSLHTTSSSCKSESEQIVLPTRRRRPLKVSSLLCCFTGSSSSDPAPSPSPPPPPPRLDNGQRQAAGLNGERHVLCQACDQWFYESCNVKGSCASQRTSIDKVVKVCTCTPALNSCLKRCTTDSRGQYNRAHMDENQQVPETPERQCRRKTVITVLSCLLPCILCHKPCKACLDQGKQEHYWGAKHIPDNSGKCSSTSPSL